MVLKLAEIVLKLRRGVDQRLMGAGETVSDGFDQVADLLAQGLLQGALKLRRGVDQGLMGAGETISERFDQLDVLLADGPPGADRFAPPRLSFLDPLPGYRILTPELGLDVL